MSIASGLPTPPFPGRAPHHGSPCDDGACADAVTAFSVLIAAAAPAPTLMKSRRPIVDPEPTILESFMVILLNGVILLKGKASIFLFLAPNCGVLISQLCSLSFPDMWFIGIRVQKRGVGSVGYRKWCSEPRRSGIGARATLGSIAFPQGYCWTGIVSECAVTRAQ